MTQPWAWVRSVGRYSLGDTAVVVLGDLDDDISTGVDADSLDDDMNRQQVIGSSTYLAGRPGGAGAGAGS